MTSTTSTHSIHHHSWYGQMSSCLADVHPSVHAVPRPAFPLHRQVTINVNGEQRTCAGGIDINDVLQTITNSLRNMNKQFWDQLPSYMQSLDPGRLQTALHELRYTLVLFVTHLSQKNVYYKRERQQVNSKKN